MSSPSASCVAPKSVLITGANSGIGFECARQLAQLEGVESIIIGCRSEAKGLKAIKELQALTNNSNQKKVTFELSIMDLTDLGSIHKAVKALDKPIEALVMNAGGIGGANPGNLTKDTKVMNMVAMNLLGHVLLMDLLIESQKLTKMAIYAGSEASRGEWRMMMGKPTVQTGSIEEFQSLCDGTYYKGSKRQDHSTTYAGTKYLAALWMGALARKQPKLRIITVSPGHTTGTALFEPEGLPFVAKFVMKNVVLPIQYLLGMAQSRETSAKRYIDVLCDAKTYHKSGTFWASKRGLTGPMCDQVVHHADFANETYQDHAYEAIHSFLNKSILENLRNQ